MLTYLSPVKSVVIVVQTDLSQTNFISQGRFLHIIIEYCNICCKNVIVNTLFICVCLFTTKRVTQVDHIKQTGLITLENVKITTVCIM